MSPGQVLEPTYRRLKRALMDGKWPAGSKLDAVRLANEFGVSMTPVRDCLNQLSGEGLVDMTPGEGFRVPSLTEHDLRNLLATNALLLEAASRGGSVHQLAAEPEVAAQLYADRLTTLFSRIASRSDNRILASFVAQLGERLHPVRRHEPKVLPDAFEVLGQIEQSICTSPAEIRTALRRYHRLCQGHAPQLVRFLSD